MSDLQTLLECLRFTNKGYGTDIDRLRNPEGPQAAQEIERLTAQVAELTRERDEARAERDEAYDVARKDARDSFAPMLAETEKQRDEARGLVAEGVAATKLATAMAEKYKRERDIARIWLVNNGNHTEACALRSGAPSLDSCTCGFDKVAGLSK